MIKIDITTSYGIVNLFSFGKDTLPAYKNEDWTIYTKSSISKLLNHPLDSVYCLKQVHGKEIISLNDKSGFERFESNNSSNEGTPSGDGLVTNFDSKILTIRTADCVPVFIWNYETPLIAALHIGWKGASVGILSKFFEAYTKENDKMGFYIGPSISAENYEVGEDVAEFFRNTPALYPSKKNKKGHYQLDLRKVITNEIKEKFPNAMLLDSGEDTFQSNIWFSHRAGEEGRNLHGIRFFALS